MVPSSSSARAAFTLLRAVTLNVWFDHTLQRPRSEALLQVISQFGQHPGNTVVCLQEVTPEVAAYLVKGLPAWSSSDPGDGSSVRPYGVMTLVRQNGSAPVRFSFHRLPTAMYRQLLVADVGGVAIGTVHLESLSNHRFREKQLQESRAVLAKYKDVLLVGDFNFDSKRNFDPRKAPLENEALKTYVPDFMDLWQQLRPGERGLTFDSETNPYIAKQERMRYDRIMVRLSTLRPTEIQRFGHQPVDDLVQLTPLEQSLLERITARQHPPLKAQAPLVLDAEPSSSTLAPEGHSFPPSLFLSDHFGLVPTFETAADECGQHQPRDDFSASGQT